MIIQEKKWIHLYTLGKYIRFPTQPRILLFCIYTKSKDTHGKMTQYMEHFSVESKFDIHKSGDCGSNYRCKINGYEYHMKGN